MHQNVSAKKCLSLLPQQGGYMSIQKPSISILIITYNRAEDTRALLENLKEQKDFRTHVGEVLLLNNASTTDYSSVDTFLNENPDFPVNYIVHEENLGVAKGRNFLIPKAKYPYLLVIDDDMIFPDADAMEQFSGYFRQDAFENESVAVISFDVYYFSNGQRQVNALPHKQYDRYKDKKRFFTYYFSGGAHLMKKEVFEQTGLYPNDFFYGMEEYDLSYRILDKGHKIAYDSTVRVLHKESPEGRVTNTAKLAMMWYNKSVVAWRYLPQKYFYSTVFMWGVHYLLKSKFDAKGFFQQLGKIRHIPKKHQTHKISKRALSYLRDVNARLWY